MSEQYHKLPSEIFGITDEYTAYCLNEVCTYIRSRIDNGETPRFKAKYKSFADMYKAYKRG